MICPECKAEYRDGFVRCSDCGVALQVFAVQASANLAPNVVTHAEASVVLWRGQDPISFSVILSALDEEGIFYKEFQRRDYAAALSRPFALGFYGLPNWEVRVCASDLNAARFIAEAALRPVSALAVEINWENESENSGRDVSETSAAPAQVQVPVKIWSGDEIEVAQQLLDALIEQGIRCWYVSSFPSGENLLVRAVEEQRARTILREVLQRMVAA